MTITTICAVDENYAIGKNNKLPWHIPHELKHFKRQTHNSIIIMGKNTFTSIIKYNKKPLQNRIHIILSSTLEQTYPNCYVFNSLNKALDFCKLLNKTLNKKVFIIGGQKLFQSTYHLSSHFIISKIHTQTQNPDTFFPYNILNNTQLIFKSQIFNTSPPYHIEIYFNPHHTKI